MVVHKKHGITYHKQLKQQIQITHVQRLVTVNYHAVFA
ncbi:hypothetical protein HPTD01_1968 [Halomonas sp. TD01]|nr:hypothetical protein HPTD01_1968 [Halomonas sp. TD01]